MKIDKNIPIPPHGSTIYPLDKLEVGDSFYVADASKRHSLATRACQLRPKKFTVRRDGEGVRVWRIA